MVAIFTTYFNNIEQMPRTIVTRRCVVTWQCPLPYGFPHCSDTPSAACWGHRTSTTQPWPCPIRLSFGCLKNTLLVTISWRRQCIHGLLQCYTKCIEKKGEYVNTWCTHGFCIVLLNLIITMQTLLNLPMYSALISHPEEIM